MRYFTKKNPDSVILLLVGATFHYNLYCDERRHAFRKLKLATSSFVDARSKFVHQTACCHIEIGRNVDANKDVLVPRGWKSQEHAR